ncbi:hypothetical protein [Streptomyces sp. NPDC051636]|uniref:hypothetical protein n=1 Tax=Streptomyces sp. NPDC051636 TaxID=3365663 RepID=UPI00379DED44
MTEDLQKRLQGALETATAMLGLPLDAPQLEALATQLAPHVRALLAKADATIAELEPVPYELPEQAPGADFEVSTYAGCTARVGLDVDLDSPAALLAERLRSTQYDVTSTEVPDETTLGITVRPQSLDCWRWWLGHLGIALDTLTTEGDAVTAAGHCKGVDIQLRGEGVPELLTDRGAARLLGLIAPATP